MNEKYFHKKYVFHNLIVCLLPFTKLAIWSTKSCKKHSITLSIFINYVAWI